MSGKLYPCLSGNPFVPLLSESPLITEIFSPVAESVTSMSGSPESFSKTKAGRSDANAKRVGVPVPSATLTSAVVDFNK